MASLQITADNAAVLTYELSDMISKINNGKGLLGRLINDQSIAKNVDQTLENLKESSQGLSENMEAAKHNFLLKGYFKKKEKEAAKKKQQQEEIKKAKEKEKAKNK
jgi:phospholipid/cholesterol/gamma-HCH transport system substrate-binding protein